MVTSENHMSASPIFRLFSRSPMFLMILSRTIPLSERPQSQVCLTRYYGRYCVTFLFMQS